jgi:hypothetical protein
MKELGPTLVQQIKDQDSNIQDSAVKEKLSWRQQGRNTIGQSEKQRTTTKICDRKIRRRRRSFFSREISSQIQA